MTLLDWDKDAESMTDAELESRIKAIAELQLWPAFKREFGWTGFHALIHTLQGEQTRRQLVAERLARQRVRALHGLD